MNNFFFSIAVIALSTLVTKADSWETPPNRSQNTFQQPLQTYTRPAVDAHSVQQQNPTLHPSGNQPSTQHRDLVSPTLQQPVDLPSSIDAHPKNTFRPNFSNLEHEGTLNLYSQHVDADVRHLVSYGGSYTEETQFGPYGATGIAEAELEFRLLDLSDFLYGTFDVWASGHLIYFIDNPDIDALPDALVDAGLDIGWCWRFMNGWSTEVRAMPGIFSDVTNPTFGIPLTLNFYFAASPTFSLKLGATYRPDFDIPIIPNVGFVWQPADEFRLELMIPESRAILFPNHRVSVFGACEWRNMTYALDEDESKSFPDHLTLDDIVATAGVSLRINDDLYITGEYGQFLQREMSADVEENNAFDLSKETFIRVMIKEAF